MNTKPFNTEKLEALTQNTATKKNIFGAVFCISSGDKSQSWCGAAGNLEIESKYYIASINKLFISAIILKQISENKLSLDDAVAQYLPVEVASGLHTLNDVDYSHHITIQHLLSQTSGLPGYLTDAPKGEKSALKQLEEGIDQPWPTDKVVERIKSMQPHFPPGKKAMYIDTNHQLLNLVIEKVIGKPVKDVLNQLFADLEMSNTYVCEDPADTSYVFPYYKDKQIKISQFITSTNNDIISTANDQMTFVRAFFEGHFYPKDQLKSLEQWKPIFFPFQNGIGIQRFYIPRVFSPFQSVPEMIGQSGSTGTLAYYVPKYDIFITGCINQQASPRTAFQTGVRLVMAARN